MPIKGALKHVEQIEGESCETLIPRLIDDLGTLYSVARRLDVYPNTILHWLKSHNYRYDVPTKKWVHKSEEDSQAATNAA
jgi:hypothetical protein